MNNATDVTNLTANAFEVFLSVKLGEDCVVVDHLSEDERRSVCAALGVDAPTHWLGALPYAAPQIGKRPIHHTDIEGRILERQEAFYEGE